MATLEENERQVELVETVKSLTRCYHRMDDRLEHAIRLLEGILERFDTPAAWRRRRQSHP